MRPHQGFLSRTPNGLLTCIQSYLLSQKDSKHPSESSFITDVTVDSDVELFMYEYYTEVEGADSVPQGGECFGWCCGTKGDNASSERVTGGVKSGDGR